MKIDVIGIPLHYGCDRFGVEKGPRKLRENGVIDILAKHGNEVHDLGDLIVPEKPASKKFAAGSTMKWVDEIIKTNENLAQAVYSSIKSGAIPFTLGGDHALGLGTTAGAAKAFGKDYGIVWIDAHGDINTAESSPSGNIHGMPLAAAMGFGADELKNIYFEGKKIEPKNVYLIAQRDLDPGEVDLIKEHNINLWTSEDIRTKGIDAIMVEVTEKMNASGINNFHISFDIDSMDSNIVPGTGTPVIDGTTVQDTKIMLSQLFKTGKIKVFDFAEYNPGLEFETTTDNCLKVVEYISKCMADATK
ncbi:arginase [uncultured Clostridium sp.]|uniref:arginase n=1 Tax=uncultured Clostridium sp. TaxID=59620 RepID=UPI002636B3CB|nr:arginase [uncultured Clostridium sp.]